jgi:hypothetical protein
MRNKLNGYARVGGKALVFAARVVLSVGAAAVLLLVLTGTSAAQRNPGGPTAPPNLDHFYCYFAPGPVSPATVMLQDQFDVALKQTEQVQDLRIIRFCNPVQKTTSNGTVTSIQHPADHLTMYLITPEPIIPRVVIVRNQFGPQQLRTGNAVVLAVPSGKVWPVPPTTVPPTTPPIPTDLDHFKCYIASGRAIDRPVLLKDQFSTDAAGGFAAVLQPILFCNPVQKTVPNPNPTTGGPGITTPITNPLAHLVCYVTTRKAFQSTLLYDNQFSPTLAPLPVFNPDFLCAPSFKLRWAEIPVPTSLTPPDDNGGGGDDNGD